MGQTHCLTFHQQCFLFSLPVYSGKEYQSLETRAKKKLTPKETGSSLSHTYSFLQFYCSLNLCCVQQVFFVLTLSLHCVPSCMFVCFSFPSILLDSLLTFHPDVMPPSLFSLNTGDPLPNLFIPHYLLLITPTLWLSQRLLQHPLSPPKACCIDEGHHLNASVMILPPLMSPPLMCQERKWKNGK